MIEPIKGIFFRDLDNDYIGHIIKEIWFDRIYDPYFAGKKDLTVVDIGANVGLFTLYASKYAKKIYAIEPAKQHFETLTQMLSFNRLEMVTPINAAVDAQDGLGTLYHNTNTTMFSLKEAVNGLPAEAEEVATLRLDSLFNMHEINEVDIMKIDCEGSESTVLGSDGFEAIADRVKLIVGEYHGWSGTNPDQLKTMLQDYGYKFEWLNKTEATVFVAERKL